MRWRSLLAREPLPDASFLHHLLPEFSPFLGSNLSLCCCSSRTSSPVPPDIRRRDPDPEDAVRQAAPALRGSPTPRSQVCAQRGWRPGPRPSPGFLRAGGPGGEKGLAQPGGRDGCGEGLAWPLPARALAPPPPALPASLTFCARIPGHRDSDAQLRGPKHQLQDQGAAVRRGRGGAGRSRVGGALGGGAAREGAGQVLRSPFTPPPCTV